MDGDANRSADGQQAHAAPARRRLDLVGLKCPQPALRARKALRALQAGALLEIVCTDPMAAIDIPHEARDCADVLEQRREGATLVFLLRRR